MKPHSLISSNASVYFLAFFLGWASYSLKLVSIIKLLGELDFKLYPLLMLAQGVSLFVSLKLMNSVSERNEKLFYFISLFLGFLVVFLTNSIDFNDWAKAKIGWQYSFIIFIVSTFIILAIDITTRLLVTSKISMLENPKAASIVTFFGEVGVLFGASLSLWLAQTLASFPSLLVSFLTSMPFTISLVFLFLLASDESSAKTRHNDQRIDLALEQHAFSLKSQLKYYLPVLIGLVSAVMLCKYIQGFAVILGLKQFQESGEQSIATLFSLLALAQNGLILLLILPSFLIKGRSTLWSRGFKKLFYIQAISMLFISIIPSPAALVGTGLLRKIVHRSFLGNSLNMLISSIPKTVRFEAKSKSQKYAHSISFLTLSVVSYFSINEMISFRVVWLLGILAALAGLYFVFLLLKRLNRFHVENILEFARCPFNVYEAISSCYSLANKDAASYYPKISGVISKEHSRSIFAKALIHTMGEMKNESAVDYLINLFRIAKREDVQLEILKALNRFDGLKVDDFMLNVLKQTMYEDIQRGELRTTFCEVISKRLPKPSISAATRAIEEHKNDNRIIGNAVDILGVIGRRLQTKKIQVYISKYLSSRYPRRTRLNAIIHLYHLPKYRARIKKIIKKLMESALEEDKAGAAYLFGVLQIDEHIEFIRELNVEARRRNSTVLLSLIRLGEEGADIDFIHLLREASQEQYLAYIKQLYRVKEDKVRYSVYMAILERYPEDVSHILHAMRDSYKNFDRDRQMIIEEADRRGIEISDDLMYLVQ